MHYLCLQEAFGSVYCYTKFQKVKKVDTGYLFPNGIAVWPSTDGSPPVLIVAETETKTLHAFDIAGPGEVCNKRVWGILPGN